MSRVALRAIALASALQLGWTLSSVSPLALLSPRSAVRFGGGRHGGGRHGGGGAWSKTPSAASARTPRTRATTALSMSLIPATDTWAIWAVLSGSAAAGCSLGGTKVGEALGAPVLAMATTFALSQFGVLPPASAAPSIGAAQGLVVRLATPLLLYSANLRRVAGATGPLLPPFFLGSVCTTLGSLVGYAVCGRALGTGLGIEIAGDAPKLAAALAAKNIGGGLNYVAVCETLKVSPIAAAAGITIDNIMALIYFPLVNWLGRNAPDPELGAEDGIDVADGSDSSGGGGGGGGVATGAAEAEALSLPKLTSAFAFAVGVIAICERLAPSFSLVASTFLTVACATLFPRRLGPLAPAGEKLGTMALYIFFATAGASGGALGSTLVGVGPALAAYLMILYTVHLTVLFSVGGALWKVRAPLLLTASNANIGGPATACALAAGRGWSSLLVPALLVGNTGYVIANMVGLLLFKFWVG